MYNKLRKLENAEYPAGMGYDKTKFRIDFTFRGQPDNYEGRQDFGDGDGSLIQYIQSYHEYYAQDESWKNHVIAKTGLEGWEQDKAERDMLLGEFVPYMKLHCNLSHMEQEARRSCFPGRNWRRSRPPISMPFLIMCRSAARFSIRASISCWSRRSCPTLTRPCRAIRNRCRPRSRRRPPEPE